MERREEEYSACSLQSAIRNLLPHLPISLTFLGGALPRYKTRTLIIPMNILRSIRYFVRDYYCKRKLSSFCPLITAFLD